MPEFKQDRGQGIFDMAFIMSIDKMELEEAKLKCHDCIDASFATFKNKEKARSAILNSYSMKSLLLCTANFNLAHQGMQVI